jgi:hypothetical protein
MQLTRRKRALLAIAVVINAFAFPLYVLWYGVRETPSLADEWLDLVSAVRTGKW